MTSAVAVCVADDASRRPGIPNFPRLAATLLALTPWVVTSFAGMILSGLHPVSVIVFYTHVFLWWWLYAYVQVSYALLLLCQRRGG